MADKSAEPNGPLGLDPKASNRPNTVNELGRNSEGVNGVGFVSQGFAAELAQTNDPPQPKPPRQ